MIHNKHDHVHDKILMIVYLSDWFPHTGRHSRTCMFRFDVILHITITLSMTSHNEEHKTINLIIDGKVTMMEVTEKYNY